jgi:hypothetical protein
MVYNCHYMTNICKNLQNFAATPRGLNLHPGNAIPKDIFTFDFDTEDQGAQSRADLRREQSCPKKTWKAKHKCPETVPGQQQKVWRHDGPWWTMDLEDNTKTNELKHKRDGNGNVIEKSQTRYSCEEWPGTFFTFFSLLPVFFLRLGT